MRQINVNLNKDEMEVQLGSSVSRELIAIKSEKDILVIGFDDLESVDKLINSLQIIRKNFTEKKEDISIPYILNKKEE